MPTRPVRIFVASPGDVAEERAALHGVAAALNDEFRAAPGPSGAVIEIQLLTWEECSRPAGGRPQQMIFDQLGGYDILIGLFWQRLGSPSGHDAFGMEIAPSGTVEEVLSALELKRSGRPIEIMLYQCRKDFFETARAAREQFARVCEFFDKVSEEKLALYGTYDSLDSFEQKVTRDLRSAALSVIQATCQSEADSPKPAEVVDPPIPLPPGTPLERRTEMERLQAVVASAHRLAVLVGKSGSGKSTLASLYFRAFPSDKKRWVSCRGKLQRSAGLLSLENYDLVVLDGFDDRPFCTTAARAIARDSRLIVTTTDEKYASLACQIRHADPAASNVRVGALTPEDWAVALRPLVQGNYVRVFETLHGLLDGYVGGLRLLRSIVDSEEQVLEELNRICVELSSYGELAESKRMGVQDRPGSARRRAPAPYLAKLWRDRNDDRGQIMWLLCRIPILGMSTTTLTSLLRLEPDNVAAHLAMLERDAFIYRVEFGGRTLWAPVEYLRTAFEGVEVTHADVHALYEIRERYLQLCDSIQSTEVIGKLDSIFVRASLAFEFGNAHAVEKSIAECVDRLQQLMSAQRLGDDAWVPVAEAIAKRATACNQVISISQTLSYMGEHALIGEIAWRMVEIEDYWAGTAAVYAAIRHWSKTPCDGERCARRLTERLENLMAERTWNSRVDRDPIADMFPAILLGGLCALGHFAEAEKLTETMPYLRSRQTAFSHLTLILNAADRLAFDELQRLIDSHWPRVRGGPIKRAAAEYLQSVCTACAGLKTDGPGIESDYDFRRTSMQLAFSRNGLSYVDRILPFRERRFKDEKIDSNILGSTHWFPNPVPELS